MPDRDKVIKEFEHLLNAAKGNYQDFVDLTVDGGEEILALLKEQEEQIERIKERPDDAQMSDEDMAKYVAKLRDSIKIDCTASMTDKKHVMSWLEGLAQDDWPMFHSDSEVQEIAKNALELLEEQLKELARMEPIEPVDDGHGSLICGNQGYECGCVGRYDLTTKVVEKYCNFCPECGREVKWHD